ncbi:methyltransferase type 11 [Phlebopus sp. FC_14]|nr:methyltransferase type 11 [Phlebopus sp. FC_14]KAH7888285.1 methyltransferase type 11 [Phlebopus sp. FC_14]
MSGGAIYTHGHHESVLRSHSWRTAENSAGYLLKYLKPDMHILDIGCGPGTITADFARLVPEGSVVGLEYGSSDDVLDKARAYAAQCHLSNITFQTGDICNLEHIPDGTYDVVHCHQVLQHIGDPVRALREMRRVAKPGGLVAAREADTKAWAWFPESETMDEWIDLYQRVTYANGGEPNAGRRMVSWALAAGFDRSEINATTGTWCFSTPEERAWWSGMWADRTVDSDFARGTLQKGLADREKLERVARHWREWGTKEDGWFALLHGEIVCRA